MDATWCPDYCLFCGDQTAGGIYCSQNCRLLGLVEAPSSSNGSVPSSPTNAHTPSVPSSRSPTNGFFLPPAFDFSPYRRASPPPSHKSRPNSSHFPSTWSNQAAISPRVLTPSSSRSSLHASTPNDCISKQAKSELALYTNSFDQVRDMKRRMTTS